MVNYSGFNQMAPSRDEEVWRDYASGLRVATELPTNIQNRFDSPGYSNIYQQIAQKSKDQLGRTADYETSRLQKGTAKRLNASGVTKGNLYQNLVNSSGSDVLRNRFEGIAAIDKQQLADEIQRMLLASNVDFQNAGLDFNKFAAIMQAIQGKSGNFRTQQEYDMKKEQQPGTLDDIFAGFNALAGNAEGIEKLGSLLGIF